MTANEHRLMVFMLAQHRIHFRTLCEILKSRGHMDESDLEAFEQLAFAGHGTDELAATFDQYLRYADGLGIQTGIPAQTGKNQTSPSEGS